MKKIVRIAVVAAGMLLLAAGSVAPAFAGLAGSAPVPRPTNMGNTF